MKRSELVKELIRHYVTTVSCKNCILFKECNFEWSSVKNCEHIFKVAFVEAEK